MEFHSVLLAHYYSCHIAHIDALGIIHLMYFVNAIWLPQFYLVFLVLSSLSVELFGAPGAAWFARCYLVCQVPSGFTDDRLFSNSK